MTGAGCYPFMRDAARRGETIYCPSCSPHRTAADAAPLDLVLNGADELIALICSRCGATFDSDGQVVRWHRPGLHHSSPAERSARS